MENEEKKFQNFSDSISPPVSMEGNNLPIPIYEGEFKLIKDGFEIVVDGSILFEWFPRPGVKIYGTIFNVSYEELDFLLIDTQAFEVSINDLNFGFCSISTNYKIDSQEVQINGMIISQSIFGDKSIPVEKIKFVVPNLRDFKGSLVKRRTDRGLQLWYSRSQFEINDFIITIDKDFDYENKVQALKHQGGFALLYSGEIVKRKGGVYFHEIKDLLKCFSLFLSFLNGIRGSALFIQGVYENEKIWTDFTPYIVSQYKSVNSWVPHISPIGGFDRLWKNFYTMWNDENGKSFLKNAIHWYTETNSNTKFLDGSIVMAQATIELIYNFYLIEKRKLIFGKDAENLSAANKIRILLSHLNVDNSIPKSFNSLKKVLDDPDLKIINAPDLFVRIRNAVVHSQENKREMLAKVSDSVKFETLQLGLYYIELSLLFVLEFEGKYFNRSAGAKWKGEGEEVVPWKR